MPVDLDRATALRWHHATQDLDQRGFPGPVAPHQGVDLTGPEVEVHTVERDRSRVAIRDAGHTDRRRAAACRRHRIATGFSGPPTAPVNGRGAATKRTAETPSAAQASERRSRSNISPNTTPALTINTTWSGCMTASVSFGRTSTPHVSEATAATSRADTSRALSR